MRYLLILVALALGACAPPPQPDIDLLCVTAASEAYDAGLAACPVVEPVQDPDPIAIMAHKAEFYECPPNGNLVVCKVGSGPPAGCEAVGSGQTTIEPKDC